MTKQNDANPEETKEWLEALRSVISEEGMDRANFIIKRLSTDISRSGHSTLSTLVNTPYCNTLAPENEERMPGDMFMERQIRAIVRWNALAMVMRANERNPGIGGHISTFASSATLSSEFRRPRTRAPHVRSRSSPRGDPPHRSTARA